MWAYLSLCVEGIWRNELKEESSENLREKESYIPILPLKRLCLDHVCDSYTSCIM